jgi:hypothetical protein
MGLRRKAFAAVLVLVPIVMLPAAPAAAAQDVGRDSVTFQYGGRTVTCEIGGYSTVDYAPEEDVTTFRLLVGLISADETCQEAVRGYCVSAYYQRRPEGPTESVVSCGAGEQEVESRVQGPVTSLDGFHSASFYCDAGMGSCQADAYFSTKPK